MTQAIQTVGRRDAGRASATTSVPRGRAYCGPAHGQWWALNGVADPPSAIELTTAGNQVRYRLVHHPRTGRPARDHLGNYVYMPVLFGFEPDGAHQRLDACG